LLAFGGAGVDGAAEDSAGAAVVGAGCAPAPKLEATKMATTLAIAVNFIGTSAAFNK
jgi:hypothetical protein